MAEGLKPEPEKADALARARRVKDEHEATLLAIRNVVGVGVGLVRRRGKATGEVGVIVMVSRKVPSVQLAEGDRIPRALDGVPVDVQEVGEFVASD